MPQAPPAKFVFDDDGRRGMALDSIISPGCIISGSKITGSVLCPNVRVHSYCTIEHSILMPGVRVGRHSRIRNAIIDRDVLIPRGAVIGYNAEEDRRRHTVSEGGVVVVTVDEEPLIGPVDEPALDVEAAGRRHGHAGRGQAGAKAKRSVRFEPEPAKAPTHCRRTIRWSAYRHRTINAFNRRRQ